VVASDVWTAVTAALEARLAVVRPQREVAFATDT